MYIPARSDAVWINLNPQAGHEQAGRRPAIILSSAAYNDKAGLAILCPITNQIKGYKDFKARRKVCKKTKRNHTR
jgi:mRNA interferase MazF